MVTGPVVGTVASETEQAWQSFLNSAYQHLVGRLDLSIQCMSHAVKPMGHATAERFTA